MIRRLFIVLLLIGTLASRAGATIIFDSYIATVDSDYYWDAWRNPFNSFTTGPDSEFLSDIWLRLEVIGDPVGTALLALYYDAAATPGSLHTALATLNDADIAQYPAWEEVHLMPNAVSLTPNTRYWIGLSTSDGSTLAWLKPGLATFDGATGVSGEYNGQGVMGDFSENSVGEGSPLQMRILTQVPEPSALILLGVGLGTLAVLRRRNRS